jgi:membrane protease YdiL (CAAX protease family)
LLSFIAIVTTYFLFSWGLPWQKIPSTISFSYIFDLLFALIVCFIFRLPWIFKWKWSRHSFYSILVVLTLAFGVIGVISGFEIEVPFRLVHNLEWHLLLFAPLLEELVFRQTFQRFLMHNIGGKRVTSMLVAGIFAFSHLIGLSVLPPEFVPFIGLQVFYTFILGVLCGQALLRFHSILAPVLLHFLFNLTFYVAMSFDVF